MDLNHFIVVAVVEFGSNNDKISNDGILVLAVENASKDRNYKKSVKMTSKYNHGCMGVISMLKGSKSQQQQKLLKKHDFPVVPSYIK